MKNIPNGGRRPRPADTRPKERDRRGSSAAAAPRRGSVSAAEVRAPWQGYERRLAAKSARRLRDHAPHTFKYKEGWFHASSAWRIEEVSETEWCHALLHPVIRAYDDYAGPLARWAEHFPVEQILILTSEVVGAEPERAAQQIYDFLGLEKPTPNSPFLHNRPNPSPRTALPGSIAELLTGLTSAGRSRLEGALSRLPARLANDLRAAMAYWRDTDQPAARATTLPKPPGMPPQADWDRLTTATFPPDLLSWSYHSAELPANSELLGLASLNFEYHYFAAP